MQGGEILDGSDEMLAAALLKGCTFSWRLNERYRLHLLIFLY